MAPLQYRQISLDKDVVTTDVRSSSAYFEENKALDDHSGRSLRSGAAVIFARGVNAIIQIVTVMFLARLLSPEDYGLVSMVAAFTGFAPVVVDLGTQDAIVQRERISRAEISALFWITIAVGTTLAVVAALCAPLIARFYDEPRLTAIVIASSATFVACATSVQHYSLLRRVMMFRELAVIEVSANVLSAAVAVASAFMGAGYWALIVRQIATPSFLAVGLWYRCGWLPGRPVLTTGVKESLRFGLNIVGWSMADFAGRSADRVAIGYRAGATVLGQYQNALFVYNNLIDVLVWPLHGVASASLSKLRHDPPELRRSWAKAISTVAFYAMPAFGLLAVIGQDLVVQMLGAKWTSAGVLLSVLAFRGIPQCVERTQGWLHVTAGRTDRWMRWGLLSALIHFGALFIGLAYGAIGVAVAYVVVMFLLFVPAIAYAGGPLGIHATDVVRSVWRQIVASVVSVGLAQTFHWTLLSDVHPLGRMTVLGIIYSVSYLVLSLGVLGLRTPLQTTRTLIGGYVPTRLGQLLD